MRSETDDPEPEDRHREPDGAEETQEVVDEPSAAQRLNDADGDSRDDGDQERRSREGERVRQPVADPSRDRFVREERAPEIAVDRGREPLDVALRHRPIEAHRLDERFALLRGHIEPHHRRGTAGSEVYEEKGEGAREHHHERPQHESLEEKTSYFFANHHSPMYCTASRSPSSGTPLSDELNTSISCGYQRKRYGSVSDVYA